MAHLPCRSSGGDLAQHGKGDAHAVVHRVCGEGHAGIGDGEPTVAANVEVHVVHTDGGVRVGHAGVQDLVDRTRAINYLVEKILRSKRGDILRYLRDDEHKQQIANDDSGAGAEAEGGPVLRTL
ncbi:hypothetical protein EJB05_46906, partial [Eragrostis curvula]